MIFSTLNTDSTTKSAGLNRAWSNSRHVCALADQDRHWGHVVLTDCWHAYDAIHPGESGTGFTYLGTYLHRSEAKRAVEASVGRSGTRKAHAAGAGSSSWNPNQVMVTLARPITR
jgi:hypothetical protein